MRRKAKVERKVEGMCVVSLLLIAVYFFSENFSASSFEMPAFAQVNEKARALTQSERTEPERKRDMAAKKRAPIAYGRHNATWSRSLFFRGYSPTTGEVLSEENLKAFADTLKGNGIEYAYLYSGPYDRDGRLPKWAFSKRARLSVEAIKKFYPELKILPWVGGIDVTSVHPGDAAWRKTAIASTRKLLRVLPVDGLHVDFEHVTPTGNGLSVEALKKNESDGKLFAEGVISFHRRLREAMPKLFISSVVVSTARDTKPWKRKHTIEELKQLFPLVDQISFLFYDTAINDQATFERSFSEQLGDIRELKQQSLLPGTRASPQVLIAIGTFINEPEYQSYRDLSIENIPNTLKVIKDGIKKTKTTSQLIDGLAVYCEWQTDADEWGSIKSNW